MKKKEKSKEEVLKHLKKFFELEEERKKRGEKTWGEYWTEEEIREILCPGSLS